MSTNLTRREAVISGGLVLGGLYLSGCQGTRSTSSLPGVKWPSGPVTTAPPAPAPLPDAGLPGSVLPRSAWTRAGVARPKEINPMNGIERITIHHDGMPPVTLGSQAQVARRIEAIRNGHVGGNGWADIGYHFVVDPQGRVWEARSLRYQGAHVKDNNPHNIGVLCLGNFDQQAPTPAQLAALDRFVAGQMHRYKVPISRVRTHQEIMPTACPGRNLQRYMVATRSGGGNLMRLAMAEAPGLAAT